jgi:hypothetical protein
MRSAPNSHNARQGSGEKPSVVAVRACAVGTLFALVGSMYFRGVLSLLIFIAVELTINRGARADSAVELGITLECEGRGRTKACPEFLLGFIDENPYLRQAPRSNADILLYVNITRVGNDDQMHFRLVGKVVGAPSVVELDTAIDTRATDDDVRKQLQPAFARSVALFIAAGHPEAVEVSFTALKTNAVAKPVLSPWGAALNINGYGNRSGRYASLSTFANISLARTTTETINRINVNTNYRVNKLPPLMVGDQVISLNTRAWGASINAMSEHQICDIWAYAVRGSFGFNDRLAPTRRAGNVEALVEWDKYPSNDPRGNQLAVAYGLGLVYERYNVLNVLGERTAVYPNHTIAAAGNFRKDHVQYNLSADATAEVLHPTQRYSLTLEPSVSWQVGSHLDLNLSFSVIKRAIPGPAEVDETDPDLLARGAYAEPLELSGSLGVSIHLDRTNGARNNRFSSL